MMSKFRDIRENTALARESRRIPCVRAGVVRSVSSPDDDRRAACNCAARNLNRCRDGSGGVEPATCSALSAPSRVTARTSCSPLSTASRRPSC